MKWLLARFAEPSTWAGLAAMVPSLAQVAADRTNPAAWSAIVGGLVAVLAPEKGAPSA